jgi:hypothetical protein
MNCPSGSQSGEASLIDYVAGKVRGPAGVELRVHIEQCRHCSSYVAQQQSVWQMLGEWEPEFESSNFSGAFSERSLAERLALMPPEPWLARTAGSIAAGKLKPAFTVTALTALLAIGVYLRSPSAPAGNLLPHSVAPKAQFVSPVEADQIDRAIADLQLLHQLDTVPEAAPHATRSM